MSTSPTVYRLGLKDAAASFGVGYMAIWQAVKAGDLPALKVGTRWLVKPDDVENYLQRVGTTNTETEAAS